MAARHAGPAGSEVAVDLAKIRARAPAALAAALRQVDHWLDLPDDTVPRALFVLGCQRSGTTMLIDTLRRSPRTVVHPEKSRLAYDAFRLRSPAVIAAITRLSPGELAVYKPLCDAHLGDRMLDAHTGSLAIWAWRGWADVANSAVRKWGAHQGEVITTIARGGADQVGWRGERLPGALVAQLAAVLDEVGPLSDHAGAALFWYVRNSFLFSLGLDADPRVMPLGYDELVTAPHATFPRVFAHLRLPFDPAWVEEVSDRSVGRDPAPEVPAPVAALCDALEARLAAL
jgi:hypothetical protein